MVLLPLLVISGQIRLDPSMVINETGYGESRFLVDEQDATKANPPTKPFVGGETAWHYPISFVLDLGTECDVQTVRVYSRHGAADIDLSDGKPFAWQPVPVKVSGSDLQVDVRTRWLQLVIRKPKTIFEVQVFGTRQGKPAAPRIAMRRPVPTIDQLIGVNAFIDDPIAKITAPANFVREYHPWGWDIEGVDGRRRFQPSAADGGKHWFFDDYYAQLNAAGVVVSPVIWQSPSPVFHAKTKEAKPISPGDDPEQPSSYRLHAEAFFQVAARYGKRKVADPLLDLAADQPRRSGLGLLNWLENWNEPDKTWEGREARFNPYELAAMASADYDGDQGRLGPNVGVRTADPAFRLALGGTAGLSLDYFRAVKFWADWHRAGDFPANAITVHHYANSNGGQWHLPGGRGVSPEDSDLHGKLLRLADWRDANLPDRELWLSEFGYDTNPKSPLHAPAIGTMSAEEVQGAWLVRSILAMAAARFDRGAVFMLRDSVPDGSTVFQTSGIVSGKGKWLPKASWSYLAKLKTTLRGYRFVQSCPTTDLSVLQYEFANAGGGRAFVLWAKTSDDRQINGYPARVPWRSVRQVPLRWLESEPLTAQNGIVRVDVSETPTILLPN